MTHTIEIHDARVRNRLVAWVTAWYWRKRGLEVINIPLSPWMSFIGVVLSESHVQRDRD